MMPREVRYAYNVNGNLCAEAIYIDSHVIMYYSILPAFLHRYPNPYLNKV